MAASRQQSFACASMAYSQEVDTAKSSSFMISANMQLQKNRWNIRWGVSIASIDEMIVL